MPHVLLTLFSLNLLSSSFYFPDVSHRIGETFVLRSFYDISFWVKVTVLGPTSHISFFELVTNISTLLVPEVRIVFLQNLFYAFTLSNSWFLEVVHLKV